MSQIPGIIFRPCFEDEESFEKGMRNTEFWTESEFIDSYRRHLAALDIVANSAKCFILKNYEKVKDWKELDIVLTHGPTGEQTEYFNFDENKNYGKRKSGTLGRLFEEMIEEDRKKHNPIIEITNVVLDPTDGDFSLTVNGKEHWWIENDEVIMIADYIEKKLKG